MSERIGRAAKVAMAQDLVEAIGYRKVVAGIQAIYDGTMSRNVEAECRYVLANLARDYSAQYGHVPEWFNLK